jgi:hypothetical protein
MRTHVALVAAVIGALIALAAPALSEPPVQPPDIGDLKIEATHYHDSGAYLTDLQLAAAPALSWISEETPRVDRPAVAVRYR